MIPYKKQNRIIALIVSLIKNKSFNSALIGLTFLFLAVASWMFFPTSSSGIHYYTLAVYMILVVGLVIVISFKKELSIPFLSAILTREFYRIKFKFPNKKPLIIRIYLEFLHFLILTFKNSEDGFNDLKDELLLKLEMILNKTPENDLDQDFKRVKETINKMKNGEDVDKADIDKMEKELLRFTEFKQKRTKKVAIIALLSLLVTITVSSLIFPQVVKTRAASFGFLQTDWSGGASTTATALHPGNETGWTTYSSKDGVSTSTPGQLSLNLDTINRKTETDNTDWQTHATSSTYYVGGSVGIIKPNGATCSSVVECSSGFCADGYCCNNACSADCVSCNNSGSEGTCSDNAVGTACGGGIKVAANLVSMPGGCADDTTNPSCSGTDVVGKFYSSSVFFDENAYSLSDGESNTINLVEDLQVANPAAQFCYDMEYNGYTDWFLPAIEQLNTLYVQRENVGGFAGERYWASTEFGGDVAYAQDFLSGAQFFGYGKSNYEFKIRCLRSY